MVEGTISRRRYPEKMIGQQKDRRGLEKIFVQIPSTDERE